MTTTTQTPAAPAAEKPATPAKKCCGLWACGHSEWCPNRAAAIADWKPIAEADKGPRR